MTEAIRTVPVPQQVLLQRLRWNILRNGVRTFFQGTPIRLVTIFACSLFVWAGIFAGSALGFHHLMGQQIPFAGGIIGTLFDLLFFALGIMLVFSSSIILYSSLFSAAETSFLLSTPIAPDQIFAFKLQGAVTFSSWAFVLLGSPILIAYGWIYAVPWYFYALLPFYFVGYVLLPGSLGALCCLVIVNVAPHQRRQLLVLAAVLVLAIITLWGYRVSTSAREVLANTDALQRLLGRLSFAQSKLVPSHWMTRGLQLTARGELVDSLYPLALVWSNGLFCYLLVGWFAKKYYRRGYNRLATGGTLRKRYGGLWMDRILERLVRFVHPQTRLLLIKDFRTFRRDPAQWGQIMIFAGLLVFYTANTRRFYQEDLGYLYQNGVSFLNLTATAFLLCAYTGRFIYPMLSLEGRKFWILGLLPLERERLLWGKFAFSATGALMIAGLLVIGSDLVLGMPWPILCLHALTVAVLSVGLSGLSVGLGACMPNFRETDPSKVAVGFGGTLSLIVGLLYLLLVIGFMALPYHILAATTLRDNELHGLALWLLVAGLLIGLGVGLAAVFVPLRMGARALKQMEF